MTVAIAHDYLTQRGGAERVVVSMLNAFPEAPVYTTLYEPNRTFPDFELAGVRASPLNRLPLLRHNHRLALPLLALAVSHMRIDADVVVCSSSGWAHGVSSPGAKIVYCHSPARWLYQGATYLTGFGAGKRLAANWLRRPLVRWDRRAAHTADRYVVNSSHVARLVGEIYGLDATVLAPPPAMTPGGAERPIHRVGPGFVLCVSRLLRYKNIDAVVTAFARLPGEQLVIVGDGPDRERLAGIAPANVAFVGIVDDPTLRWLYGNASGLVAAAYEDYGLTPLEAASFGKPTAALRFGGFLDTLVEGSTGVFFDDPERAAVAAAVARLLDEPWDAQALQTHAALFSEERFVGGLRAIVEEATSETGR